MGTQDRAGGGDEPRDFKAAAFAQHHEIKRYRIALDTDDGIDTREVEAFMYSDGLGSNALVTFFGEEGAVASFNTKLVREISIVSPDDAAPPP